MLSNPQKNPPVGAERNMNLHDINIRIECIYESINKTNDGSLTRYLQAKFDMATKMPYFKTVDGLRNELETKLYDIIHDLALLKDHLISIYAQNDASLIDIKSIIENCPGLKLLISIAHKEQNGNARPKLANIKSKIIVPSGDDWKISTKNSFDLAPDGTFLVKKDITVNLSYRQVYVSAEIVNDKGQIMMNFSEMIRDTLSAWEGIVSKFD